MPNSTFFLKVLLVGAVLPFTFAPTSLAGSPQTATGEQWYIANWGQTNGEHATHAGAGPRVWEPDREIDPRAVRGFQEMYEVTQFPGGEPPTIAQRRQAEELVRRCRDAAARHGWFEFEKTKDDGFELLYDDPWHYVNPLHALDDAQLDPDRPEFLMFYDTPSGKRLAAFMFLARGVADHGRQVGGPLTLWHFHVWAKPKCLREGRFVVGDADGDGRCADGVAVSRSPEMMHVWLIDHPNGPFSGDMSLTEEMLKRLEQPVSR